MLLLHSVREFGIIGWQPRNALAHLALTANAAPAHDHGWPGGLPSPAHPRLFCRRPNGTAFIPIALTVEMTVLDCIPSLLAYGRGSAYSSARPCAVRDPALGHRTTMRGCLSAKTSMINLTISIRVLREFALPPQAPKSFLPRYLVVGRRGRALRRSEMRWRPESPIGLWQVQEYALGARSDPKIDMDRRTVFQPA